MRSRVSVLAVAALGFLIAPAGFAQQNVTSVGVSDTTTSDSATDKSTAPAPKFSGALPSAGKSKSMSDAHIKPGTDFPRWEAFFGYSFFAMRPGASFTGNTLFNGGSASLAYNLNHWVGLVADFGGYNTGTVNNLTIDPTLYTYMFGPRFSYRNNTKVTPFAQILFGGAHCGVDCEFPASTNSFAFAAGGGLDWMFSRHWGWRVVQVEYVLTNFNNPGGSEPQNDIRVSSGLLIGWGARPETTNRAPSATCSADKKEVMAGSGDTVPVHVSASDPDGDALTYSWTASGGRVDGSGADARWNSAGAGAGSYTVTARVDDGHGGTASCSADIRVTAPPPPPAPKPPVMSCSADRSNVMAGERVNISANASSPQNFALTYAWQANGGQVVGTGANVQFDTTGLAPGTYTITGRVDDGHNGAADCTASVTVQQPPPPPQASKINECAFKPAASARVDNVCKRVLDDVALRLQNEPKGTVVIVGYADPKAKGAKKSSTDRAENAAKYLAGKGIDRSRITVRSGDGQAGAGAANDRVDIIWVPEGATY